MRQRVFYTIIFIMFVMQSIYSQEADSTSLTKVGQRVPEFSVTTIDGKHIQMGGLRDKVVWINFFATRCGPCMQEMPRLEKEIRQKFRNEDFIVLAIGREHSAEELRVFQKEKGFNFLMTPDPNRKVYSLFATQSIPRNYIIGKDGRILYQSIGYTPEEFQALYTQHKVVFRFLSETSPKSSP